MADAYWRPGGSPEVIKGCASKSPVVLTGFSHDIALS